MIEDFYGFRDSLVDEVLRDLIGPASEREEIDDAPLDRYISGVIYPRSGETVDAWNDVDVADGDEEVGEFSDPPVALANVRYPSSMGMTFSTDTAAESAIEVTVEAARYEAIETDHEDGPVSGKRRRRGAGPSDQKWIRIPITIEPITLVTTTASTQQIPLDDGLELFSKVRAADEHGVASVTLALINVNPRPEGLRDSYCFFQPRLTVAGPKTESTAFVERRGDASVMEDEDLATYELLYRHARSFAIGHGCSVDWDADVGSTRARSISTVLAPTFDLRVAESNPAVTSPALSLLHLVDAGRVDLIGELDQFIDTYETWVQIREGELSDLPVTLQETGRRHLDVCLEACRRMRTGVQLLANDDVVWRAFRLANSAMLQQRARIEWIKGGRSTAQPDLLGENSWRPFQLGFILLCLPGIADRSSPDREMADLLWFPTGGGKTEAYLGLIAFTSFLRRLRGEGGGVTALMRYTLRLLTIQQFERAALIICCCEAIRRSDPDLGDDPFAVGLWIGEDGTPNTRKKARQSLDMLRNGQRLEKVNPVQLHRCPWCGTGLDQLNYWLATDVPRLVVACREADCDFSDGLPVYVIDEDIYDYRPTLLIATADKFASLPWREKDAELFNLNSQAATPPDLIIQDELHLISGPLGTLAGLYETAVDLLATREGVPPKVIASTATIRRADSQVSALFARAFRQFPPPALDARDSFFAVDASPERVGTRRYVGLMAPGTSQSTLMIRTYAALLQGAASLPAPDDAVRDPYWTLVGYFNSLRVLSGARMQVLDDVNDRLQLIAGDGGPRTIDERIELTSREPSADIPDHLQHLTIAHPDQRALDVVLATNMISVGVDIDRLGLMVVMGQPQSTSEYIQATSRIGRRHPGLVVVLFNAARSRDRSHYESFTTYHSALYRQVESTSVTPFSSRARDRALHGVLVAMVRMMIPDMRPNSAAAEAPQYPAEIALAVEAIMRRVSRVAPDEIAATQAQLDDLVKEWFDQAGSDSGLCYWVKDPAHSLLVDAARANDPGAEDSFATLWSLRDVDQASGLYVVPASWSGGGAHRA